MRRLFSTLRIYTDGSFIRNHGGGMGIYFPNNEHPSLSIPYPKTLSIPPTNQRCELMAVSSAMIIHTLWFRERDCIIYTDSQYAINSLTKYCNLWNKNGWRKMNGQPVKNTDLLIPMSIMFNRTPNLSFQYVRAHTGKLDEHSLNNNIADAYARKGTTFPYEPSL